MATLREIQLASSGGEYRKEPPRRSVAAPVQDARPKLSSQREADDHPEIPKPVSDPYENDPPRGSRELKYEIWQLWGEKRIEHRFLLGKKLWRRNWFGRRNEASLIPWARTDSRCELTLNYRTNVRKGAVASCSREAVVSSTRQPLSCRYAASSDCLAFVCNTQPRILAPSQPTDYSATRGWSQRSRDHRV